jgi:hypothetical protein
MAKYKNRVEDIFFEARMNGEGISQAFSKKNWITGGRWPLSLTSSSKLDKVI